MAEIRPVFDSKDIELAVEFGFRGSQRGWSLSYTLESLRQVLKGYEKLPDSFTSNKEHRDHNLEQNQTKKED